MHLPLAAIGLGGGELMIIFLIFGIFCFPIWLIPPILCYHLLEKIPPQDRRQEPALALLLLIPLFNLVWAFWVYPRIAESLAAHFRRVGDTSVDDCGATLALVICVCQIVPGVNLVALICEIVFFVKAYGLTSRIVRPPLAGYGTPPIAPPVA
jgi:hypothetical protein